MKRPIVILALALVSVACAEPESEPSHSSMATRPASGQNARLSDWLPPDTARPGAARPRAANPAPGAPGHGSAPVAAPRPAAAPPSGGATRGTVTETMNSGGYTYIHVQTSNGLVWVAANQQEVAVGSTVEATGAMMQGFRSNTLNRTFDRLVLASSVVVTPAAPAAPSE